MKEVGVTDHPFGTYTKCSKKLTFLPPDTHTGWSLKTIQV